MKRPLLLVALGSLSILLLIEFGLRAVEEDLPDWRPWPTYESRIKYQQMSTETSETDVVFVGTSSTEAGVSPAVIEAETGLTVYNAALPFSSPLALEAWLEEFVVPALTPRVVVFGFGSWPTESELASDPLRTGFERVHELERDPFSGLALFRQRTQLRNWSQTRATRRLSASIGNISPLGQQLGYAEIKVDPAGRPPTVSLQGDAINDANRAAFERTAAYLKGLDIDVVLLVEPPGCPPSLNPCPAVDPLRHPARVFAEALDLALVDDPAASWPSYLYADSVHLNAAGAEQWSRLIAAQLIGLGYSK